MSTRSRAQAASSTQTGAPIIIDNGSHTFKAGFGGEEKPRVTFPAIVALDNRTTDFAIGKDALKKLKSPSSFLRYPIMRGLVMDWDQMENIWDYTFNSLKVDPKNHAMMMTANAYTPLEHRETMIEMVFERFSTPSFYCAIPGYLTLYGTGENSGIVVESGAAVSHIVPVAHGVAMPHSIVRMPFAGQDVSEYLSKLVAAAGSQLEAKEEHKIIRHIKHNMAYVALDFDEELIGVKEDPARFAQLLELPSGEQMELGSECFRCAEVMFEPSLVGAEGVGIHQLLFDCINKTDSSVRKLMFSNIVLGGGNMLFPGTSERMEKELKQLLNSSKQSVRGLKVVQSNNEFSAWQGGSVLTAHPDMKNAWISKAEYDEHGPSIVLKRCF